MQRICVYCGSSLGRRPLYAENARRLAQALVERGLGLVYGGASVGVMGVLADAVLAAGGEVVGIIPRGLVAKEVGHSGLSDLRVVDSMHERKALMADRSDAFIALPGGIGTFEELCEIMTWSQLGIHAKPVGLLNVESFFDPFLRMLDHAVDEGFLKPPHRETLLVSTSPAELLNACAAYNPPPVRRWMTAEGM